MQIFITILSCIVFLYWFFGGFEWKKRERLRRANRRNKRSHELLKERGRAWEAYDNERTRDCQSPVLPKLRRDYYLARAQYESFPIDWTPATL